MSKEKSTSCAKIVKGILYPSVLNLPAFTYGHENEASSRMMSRKLKQNIEIAGLLIDANEEYLGASTDGLIGNDGIVELKNPISAANMTIPQALKRNQHLRRIFSKENINKMNQKHEYYYQIQGQLHITQRYYCIFALCTKIDIKYIRVERDDDFWEVKMAESLRKFYFDSLLPKILDSRYNRNMPLREPEYVLEAQREQQRKAAEKASNVQEKSVRLLNTPKNKRNRKRKTEMTSQTKKKQSLTEPFVSTAEDVNNRSTDMESLQGTAENDRDMSTTDSNYESIEDQRNILAALYVNCNMDELYNNILDVGSLLHDDTIACFLQVVQKKRRTMKFTQPSTFNIMIFYQNNI